MLDSFKITQNIGPAHVGVEWDICSLSERGRGPKAEAKYVKQHHNINSNAGSLFLIPFMVRYAKTSQIPITYRSLLVVIRKSIFRNENDRNLRYIELPSRFNLTIHFILNCHYNINGSSPAKPSFLFSGIFLLLFC